MTASDRANDSQFGGLKVGKGKLACLPAYYHALPTELITFMDMYVHKYNLYKLARVPTFIFDLSPFLSTIILIIYIAIESCVQFVAVCMGYIATQQLHNRLG